VGLPRESKISRGMMAVMRRVSSVGRVIVINL
jgi:hypothetical protein